MDMLGQVGLGHVPRPRNFAIGKLVAIGRFPCELPPAVLTHNILRYVVAASPAWSRLQKTPDQKGQVIFVEGQVGLSPSAPPFVYKNM